jgi:hypothetical protein
MASSEQSINTEPSQTNPSISNQETNEIDYCTKIINLVAEINAKDIAFRDSINHAGTINKAELKYFMYRACKKLEIISWTYSHKTAICNQLTDIISSCLKQHLGSNANSDELPEINVKFMYGDLSFSYMYVLNDSTIIIPIQAMPNDCKINIYYPYRVRGYHNAYDYQQVSKTPLCIYTSDKLSPTQTKKITKEILRCINDPPLAK